MHTHEAIRSGIVFARQDMVLPAGVHIGNEAYARGWSMLSQGDSFALDKTIRASGWSFFFMAAEITSAAFGQPTPANFRQAIVRALRKVPQEFNSAEVTEIAAKRFLGIPYLAVRTHPRHIQEHLFLYSAEDQTRSAPRTAPLPAAVP